MGDAMSQVPMRLRLVSAYGGWIYTHFEAYRLEYEVMLPWVGIEPGCAFSTREGQIPASPDRAGVK